jgi:hypothetical protein
VQHTENAIGYVELTYSVQHDLPYAGVRNRAGNFVLPTLESVNAAAAAAATAMPGDFRVSITDADAQDAYPISSFTWLLVPVRFTDPEKSTAMKRFLAWKPGLAAFIAGWGSHVVIDMLTHRSDGYPIFWPLSGYRFPTPVSYWEQAYHGRAFSLVCDGAMVVLLVRLVALRTRRPRVARSTT